MKIKPFKAIRPKEFFVREVASLPYDVYSEKEARDIVRKNPNSFLTVVRPETTFPEGVDIYSDEVYLAAKQLIDDNISMGIYEQENHDCYYIYRQIMNGRVQTGLVACFSVDDYINNKIKKHEFTRPDKEDDRMRHINICRAQTGLAFLAFRENDEARALLDECAESEPVYDFTSVDNVRQIVWRVAGQDKVRRLTEVFAGIESLYICDGHHRSASAATVAKKCREANPGYTGEEEFNYYMAVAFPYEDLLVMPYYRVVKDLNGHSVPEFLKLLEKSFIIEEKALKAYEPKNKGEVAMYLDGIWFKLTARPEILKYDAIGCLDVSMLQDNILTPILGIENIRTSDRIDFVGGIRGTAELEKRCHEDCVVAFATRHTTLNQLMRVSDEGKVMPPKSTWFEPKLQSGLFIHRF